MPTLDEMSPEQRAQVIDRLGVPDEHKDALRKQYGITGPTTAAPPTPPPTPTPRVRATFEREYRFPEPVPSETFPATQAAPSPVPAPAPTPSTAAPQQPTGPQMPAALDIYRRYLLPGAAMTAGAAEGAATGAPFGPIGSVVGGAIGAGGGNIFADAIGTILARKYGIPAQMGPRQVLESGAVGAGAELAGPLISKGAGWLVGADALKRAVTEAATKVPGREAEASALGRVLQDTRQEIAEKVDVLQRKVQEQTIAARGPAAAQAELEEFLGRTKGQQQAGAFAAAETTERGIPTSLEHAQAAKQMRDAFRGAHTEGTKYYNKIFDAALEKHTHREFPPDPLNAIREFGDLHNKFTGERGIVLQPKVQKLIDEAAALGKLGKQDVDLTGYAPDARAQIERELAKSEAPVTFGQVRGLWQRANALSAADFTGPQAGYNKSAMTKLADTLRNALADAGGPDLKDANTMYRDWKLALSDATMSKVGRARSPSQLGFLFEGEPQQRAIMDLLRVATPEQRREMQHAFADYVLGKNLTFRQVGQKYAEPFLRAMYPNSNLGRASTWLRLDADKVPWEALERADPLARAEMQQGIDDVSRPFQRKMLRRFQRTAVSALNRLGEQGKADAIAIKRETPEIAAEKIVEMVRNGRLALPNLQRETEVEALRGIKPDPLFKYLGRRAMFIIPLAIGMARPSGYVFGSLTLMGALSVPLMMRHLTRLVLRNPEMASTVLDTLGQMASRDKARMLGRNLGRLATGAEAHALEQWSGLGPQPPPTPTPTPGTGFQWLSPQDKAMVLNATKTQAEAKGEQPEAKEH